VPGRLVVHEPPVHFLLDQAEPSLALHHRGDRHAGFPDRSQAALRVFFRMKSAIRATPPSIACREAA
jgi:hypothetical protein